MTGPLSSRRSPPSTLAGTASCWRPVHRPGAGQRRRRPPGPHRHRGRDRPRSLYRPAGRPGHRPGARQRPGDPGRRHLHAGRDRCRAAGHAGGSEFLVATDARRKELYWARYSAAGERLTGPEVCPASELPAGLPVAGEGALLYPETGARPIEPRYPAAAWLAALAAQRQAAGQPPGPGGAAVPATARRPGAGPAQAGDAVRPAPRPAAAGRPPVPGDPARPRRTAATRRPGCGR